MSQKNKGIIFLIDFENVHNTGLDGVKYLENNDSIIFFVSEPSAIKARREYLDIISNSGAEMEFRKLVKTGKNGLDFYIATELGFIKGKGEIDQSLLSAEILDILLLLIIGNPRELLIISF